MGNGIQHCVCCDGLRAWMNSSSAQSSASGIGAEVRSHHDLAAVEEARPSDLLPQGLSRNQQKKLLARQARQDRKGQKKVQKQSDSLAIALGRLAEMLPAPPGALDASQPEGVRLRLCAAFGARAGYRSLPLAFGPQLDEGMAAVGSVLVRPEKYGAKFLPQEYSLLHKLWAVLGGDCAGAGVLDIGAGNANCAVLAAMLLGLTVICVERESPREELRAEMQLPPHLRSRIIRLEADIEDFGRAQLQEVASAHGLSRMVFVAKHPCGVGVDRSIECAARLQADQRAGATSVTIVGAVIATCCTNKLCLDDNQVSRVSEFCNFYSQDLPAFVGDLGMAQLERTVEIMSRCSAWRTAAGSNGNAIHTDQLEWAELFEDALQTLRLRRLDRIFGASTEVRFAPSSCTLQDRCLIAGPPPLPTGIFAHDGTSSDPAFLAQLRQSAGRLLADTGAIDCRPRGLKSAKYGFDYSNGMGDDLEGLSD